MTGAGSLAPPSRSGARYHATHTMLGTSIRSLVSATTAPAGRRSMV
ncbi:hypothetical protein KCP76_19800 [Salmonella enterica subsp. enterica serovar Weltevreden]|nr:hypothetical protein KCP76_19800 [Salmonella enterica subsp. enterica serovar Weltevreden]